MQKRKLFHFIIYPLFACGLMMGLQFAVQAEETAPATDDTTPVVEVESPTESVVDTVEPTANPVAETVTESNEASTAMASTAATTAATNTAATDTATETSTYREQYHFSNEKGWSNDPNGMVYFKGQWHLFFQYYPDGVNHGPMSWGHAVSTDLVHWNEYEIPDVFSATGERVHWSGSCVWDKNNTSGFFDGVEGGGLVAIWTIAALPDSMSYSDGGSQRQGIAYSIDGFNWIEPDLGFDRMYINTTTGEVRELTDAEKEYYKNVILAEYNIPKAINGEYVSDDPLADNDFRDPKVFWNEEAGLWFLVCAGGPLRIYSSPDLKNWTAEAMQSEIMTECPEIYHLQIQGTNEYKYVLSEGGRWYQIGDFKQVNGIWTFVPDTNPDGSIARYEMNFAPDAYAAQSFFIPESDRTIMIQWMSNWSYADDTTIDGVAYPGLRKILGENHNGQFTLLADLYLIHTAEGLRMAQKPISEYDQLKNATFNYNNVTIGNINSNILSGIQSQRFQMKLDITPGSATKEIVLEVLKNDTYSTKVIYNVLSQTLTVDRSNSMDPALAPADHEQNGTWFKFLAAYSAPVPLKDGRLQLHIFVDDYSIEVYAYDYTVVLTELVFPAKDAVNMSIYSIGEPAKANIAFSTMDSTRTGNINYRNLTATMQIAYNVLQQNHGRLNFRLAQLQMVYNFAKQLVFSGQASQCCVNVMDMVMHLSLVNAKRCFWNMNMGHHRSHKVIKRAMTYRY